MDIAPTATFTPFTTLAGTSVSNLVDGDPASLGWVSSSFGTSEWLLIVFPTPVLVTHVVLFPRQDLGANGYKQAQVRLSMFASADASGSPLRDVGMAPVVSGSPQHLCVSTRPGCNACAAGGYNSLTTGTIGCTTCSVGSYGAVAGASAASVCTGCRAGTFAAVDGSTACATCSVGSYGSVTGAVSSRVCTQCASGFYSSVTVGSAGCTVCTAGKYGSLKGASSSEVCTGCVTGRYGSVTKATSPTVCTSCAAGRYNDLTSVVACTACTRGRYGTRPVVCPATTAYSLTPVSGVQSIVFTSNCGANCDGYLNFAEVRSISLSLSLFIYLPLC